MFYLIKGANQAVTAGRLLAKTCFTGQFGQDEAGDNLVQGLDKFYLKFNS